MRGPSVYWYAWLHGCLVAPVVFFGLLFAVFLANGLDDPYRAPGLVVSGIGLAAFVLTQHIFPACPRCGCSPYSRGGGHWWSSIPRSHCDKCDLDLKDFGLFDRKAKREPHV